MMGRGAFLIVVSAFALQSCGDGTSPILHSDIERARADWLAARPPSYRYDVGVDGQSGRHRFRVTVQNHVVTSSVPLSSGSGGQFDVTIEDIWTHILSAVDRDQVNSVLFDNRGIPVRANVGIWALDSGVFYEITRFDRL